MKRAKGDVFVITGPYYSERPRRLSSGKVLGTGLHVQAGVRPRSGSRLGSGLPNDEGVKVQWPISYDELVKRTGILFFGLSASGHL